MSKVGAIGWEKSIQRTLGRDVSVGPHGLSIFITCKGGCGETIQFQTPKIMSPEGLRRKLEVDGWKLAGRRTCPNCNAALLPLSKEEPVTDQPKLAVVPKPAAALSPTDAARAMRRAVIQWLEEAYDVDKRVYRSGISDASIAKETGASLVLVKQLREENYGPLSTPLEITELVEELAAIKSQGQEARQELDVKLSALNGRQAAVEQKLARLAQKNGWTV